MKKSDNRNENEILPEYDFAKMPGGVKGKYAQRYRQGTNLVLLDADTAKVFPNDRAVNEALRVVMNAAARLRRHKTPLRRRRTVRAR